MPSYRRHAVYYAPPAASALAEFGARWLGWDAERGRTVPHPVISDLPLPVEDITERPRRYGFHATLKPPFRLVGEETAFRDALADFAAGQAPFEAPALRLARLGGFLALTPSRHSAALGDLAFDCVRDLDRFRAAPTEAELAKRRANSLSQAQETMLSAYGYPYVGPEFRFHLTLTGGFEAAMAEEIRLILAAHVAPYCAAPLTVSEICWFAEDEDDRFHIIERFPLTG